MHDKTIYSDGHNTWAIQVIREEAAGLPVERAAIQQIGDLGTAEWLVDCVRRIQECDPDEPVILGPDGQLLYGNCQIARARLEGRTHVPAVRLAFMPEPVTSIENRRGK
jgi:hypothetical protein